MWFFVVFWGGGGRVNRICLIDRVLDHSDPDPTFNFDDDFRAADEPPKTHHIRDLLKAEGW